IAGAIGPLRTLRDDPHLAFEDQQSRVELVRMLGVCLVRLHPTIGDLEITLVAQRGLELHPVHRPPPLENRAPIASAMIARASPAGDATNSHDPPYLLAPVRRSASARLPTPPIAAANTPPP